MARAPTSQTAPDGVQARVFREKDIPIQIALGNYDLGICRLEWVEDLARRYPTNAIVRLRDLEIGRRSLYVAADAARDGDIRDWAQLTGLRIVSEYANIAEALAIGLRLSAYRVFPVWGSAEAYPPEDADLALVAAADEDDVRQPWSGASPQASRQLRLADRKPRKRVRPRSGLGAGFAERSGQRAQRKADARAAACAGGGLTTAGRESSESG